MARPTLDEIRARVGGPLPKGVDSTSRYAYARRIIAGLNIPADASEGEVKRILFDAYPWGERSMYPYKAWCRAVRDFKRGRKK